MTSTAVLGTSVLNAPRHRTKLSRRVVGNDWLELEFVPEYGCHWTRLRLSVKGEWIDFIHPVPDGDTLLDRPTGHGCYLLAPWSSRIPNGEFRFGGQTYTVRKNWEDGSAIHGDVRLRPWTTERADEGFFEATLDSRELDDFNYPFALRFHHSLEASEDRLTVGMTVENVDEVPAPVGLGYHPFVLRRLTWRDDDVILQVPAEHVYPARAAVPIDRPVPVDGSLDLRSLRPLGAHDLDHCFTGLTENRFRIIYPGSRVEVRFELDENFSHAIVYAPNSRDGNGNGNPIASPSFAIEPVTHVADGFNFLDKGWPDTGVRVLEPGEQWHTRWWLTAGDV